MSNMKIHFLQTEWSDIIILQNRQEIAFIDTGFEEQFDQICGYIKNHFKAPVKIKFILNTHFHRDHYGCISKLTENFDVEKVYLKEYSGLDCTTAWGTVADDEYRQTEMEKFQKLKAELEQKNKYIPVETVDTISFGDAVIHLYNTENTIRKIYEDESNSETYHKIMFSENTNSLAAFMEIDGHAIFFGGDCNDLTQPHLLADKMLYRIAKKINNKIDLYKVPHHGTWHTGLPETLEIFKPKVAIFTNSKEYVLNESDAFTNLKTANPKVKIGWTKDSSYIIDTDKDLGFCESARIISFAAVLLTGLITGFIYLRNISSFFAYLILMPIYSIFLLIPPICIVSIPIYILIGVSIYKWFKKGKIVWLILNAGISIPLFVYLLKCIDMSMGI